MGVLLQAIADFGYGLVFLGVFLDTVGLPIPGEAVLMGIGFLAFQGTLHPLPAILFATLGTAAGDSLMFLLGRRLGQKREERLVQLYCRWSACTLGSAHCLGRTEHHLKKFQGWALLFIRFVVGVRAFTAPLMGMSGYPYRRFIFFDSVGAVLWSVVYILLGVQAGRGWERLAGAAYQFHFHAGILIIVTALAFMIFKVYRRLRYGRANPFGHEDISLGPQEDGAL